jgi:hypothetical protein
MAAASLGAISAPSGFVCGLGLIAQMKAPPNLFAATHSATARSVLLPSHLPPAACSPGSYPISTCATNRWCEDHMSPEASENKVRRKIKTKNQRRLDLFQVSKTGGKKANREATNPKKWRERGNASCKEDDVEQLRKATTP